MAAHVEIDSRVEDGKRRKLGTTQMLIASAQEIMAEEAGLIMPHLQP